LSYRPVRKRAQNVKPNWRAATKNSSSLTTERALDHCRADLSRGRGGIQSYYCRFCGDVIFGRYGGANLPPVLSPLHVADACRQYNRRNLAGGGAGARTVRCQRAARTGLATRVPRPGKSDLALFTICT